ncbi:MAG: JAB domain-containing protein, partial [Pseudomonadota bacterium]
MEPPFDPTPPATEFPKHTPRHTPQQRQRPHYWGHRQRVRDRFAAGGAESMPDYEIIELLLFSAIPKIDVKPLAKQLLEDFGGIERLLTARREELARHPKVNDWIVHHFKLAEAVAIRLAKTKIADKPLLSSTKAVREYLRTRMAHSPVELLVAVFLDHHHRLITDEELGRGTVNHAPAYP